MIHRYFDTFPISAALISSPTLYVAIRKFPITTLKRRINITTHACTTRPLSIPGWKKPPNKKTQRSAKASERQARTRGRTMATAADICDSLDWIHKGSRKRLVRRRRVPKLGRDFAREGFVFMGGFTSVGGEGVHGAGWRSGRALMTLVGEEGPIAAYRDRPTATNNHSIMSVCQLTRTCGGARPRRRSVRASRRLRTARFSLSFGRDGGGCSGWFSGYVEIFICEIGIGRGWFRLCSK